MPTRRRTIDLLLDRAGAAGDIAAKPMFGEFGLYLDGRMIGSVCDDRLFLKPTPAGRAIAPDALEAPPYPGAKPQLVVEADRWDDADWLCTLLRATLAGLPAPRKARRHS